MGYKDKTFSIIDSTWRATDWMSRLDRLPHGQLHQDVACNLRMQVAHRANFLDWHPLGHEFLFHRHDLGRIGLAHNLAKLTFHLFGRISSVQMLDDLFQCPNTVGSVGEQFAHFQSP
jgi:hypothetical protein